MFGVPVSASLGAGTAEGGINADDDKVLLQQFGFRKRGTIRHFLLSAFGREDDSVHYTY
jgi:hypothetical protein